MHLPPWSPAHHEGHHRAGRESVAVAVLANSQQMHKSFPYPLTIRSQLDILQFGWQGSECNSIN
jgi:hypothetical protein